LIYIYYNIYNIYHNMIALFEFINMIHISLGKSIMSVNITRFLSLNIQIFGYLDRYKYLDIWINTNI